MSRSQQAKFVHVAAELRIFQTALASHSDEQEREQQIKKIKVEFEQINKM